MQNPKYSIIIPVRNGGKYLPTCVETITSQGFNDYELIISDDHSTDETCYFLNTIVHPNVTIVYPPEGLSMTEHWEWALSHAQGEWLIFVGQDDGLQLYFFQLAEILTPIALKTKVRTIMSSRANFFWPGCNDVYGNIAVGYYASNKIELKNSKYQALRALLGFQNYFVLPEMYTTSLFHRDILEEVKKKQKGKVLVAHPQDANLAAIACSLDKRYLESEIPLGWVGTSPKSAGLAISTKDANDIQGKNELDKLRREYAGKIEKSAFPYNPLAGDFSFGSCILYFWQTLLQTKHLRNRVSNMVIESGFFKTIMFGRILLEMNNLKLTTSDKFMPEFRRIVELNNCNLNIVIFFSKLKFPVLANLTVRLIRKLYRIICERKIEYIDYVIYWQDISDVDMVKASAHIFDLLNEKKLIEKLTF